MRAETARAERALEVRRAARAWKGAGTIDESTLASIEGAYSDDRVRARSAFRVLFFLFTAFAAFAAFGLVAVSGLDSAVSLGALAIVFGVGLAALTEVQTGPLRRDRGGTEEATGFCAIVFLMGGSGWIVFDVMRMTGRGGTTAVLIVSAILLAAAAWRWGHTLAAAAAALCAFWVLARVPYGRTLWMLGGALAAATLLRAASSPRLAPSHRRACAAALVVALLGLYGAVSILSLDHALVETIGDRTYGSWWTIWGRSYVDESTTVPAVTWSFVRVLSALATALLPPAIVAWGIRRRSRLLIDVGGVLAALSILTLRAYVHLAATWLLLALSGAALIAGALALRRWLEAGPDRERSGFTAEPLFESDERRSAALVAATVAAMSPAGRPIEHPEPGYVGKGGASGGAGAGGQY